MRKYEHIFFDLDDTLWDFKENSNQALTFLFHKYQLDNYQVKLDSLLDMFHKINNRLWKQYSYGRIDKEFLRSKRFKLIFRALGYCDDEKSVEFGHEYLSLCPYNKQLKQGSIEILEYLQPTYKLHVITNGFEEIAHIKLSSAGLEKYFTEIITSEKAGHKKPSGKIYDYAIGVCMATRSNSIMIGNDIDSDIKGAKEAGLDQVFYNPEKRAIDFHPTFEIEQLSQIMNFL